ncbi:glycosyltransferase family 4 protein [Trichothermofontia sichuanensis B231]|uniref:glycosyltransferase family 4 protein n=1 Tax=Trichothermofontia sichuanensis TaxID=3045816 RepID=UPI002245B123|nr:glycosyltransferase family 1 protein [Trichothermofontia sichuanensis]UZQ53817.1 glycosyltransferase family 4 protein [Trichothermofontia sichuanensis B231]
MLRPSPAGLLINLAFLSRRPTGHTNYALQVLPYLAALQPQVLVPADQIEQLAPLGAHPSAKTIGPAAVSIPPWESYAIASNMTPDQRTWGHLRRLVWTQVRLPAIYRSTHANLLFSPIPEAPLDTNCRFVVTVHDLIPLHFGGRWSRLATYFRYYVPRVLEQAVHILCNSQATMQDVQSTFGIPADKLTVTPLGYDDRHFRDLALPTGNYFLCLGRHDRYKNIPRLINAFAALADPDCELWLAGPSDRRYTPALHAQVAALNLQQQVKFLDYVPYADLPRLLGQAIALVFPSLYEGFGLPVLEAMACGTPVITSDCSALPEVAGDAALLVNPHIEGEITEAMRGLLADANLRSRLRQAGLARVQGFSWAKTGAITREVLQRYL